MEPFTILIADDDPAFLKALTIRLGQNNFKVVTASDAYQALQKAKAEKPDLLIIDINMPAGDGFSVVERLQAMGSVGMPVFFVTGEKSVRVETLSRSLGATGVFYKPVDMPSLIATIQQALLLT